MPPGLLAPRRVVVRLLTLTRHASPPRHLVIGSGPDAARLALNLRRDGTRVVLLGRPEPAVTTHLSTHGVRVRPFPDDQQLAALVGGAVSVSVYGDTDLDTELLAQRVTRLAGAQFPTLALFDTRAAARAHRSSCPGAMDRVDLHVLATLRACSPWPGDQAAPPPVVIGAGATAEELVRRIAVGWQGRGETPTIHLVTPDAAGAARLTAELGRGGADLATVTLDAATLTAGRVEEAVAGRIEGWRAPPPRHATVTGPTIYVVADPAAALPLARSLAGRFPSARVAVVTAGASWERGVVVVDLDQVLADPAVLGFTPAQRLAQEFLAEAERWPQDVPSVLGPLANAAAAARAQTLASAADDLLRAVGIIVADDGASEPIQLDPDELRTLRDRMVGLVPAPPGTDAAEHRQRALEFAAVLPALMARAGRHLRRPPGHTDLLSRDQIQSLARLAHERYRATARALGHATGSEIAHQSWGEVDDFTRASNAAQIADVPAKLVAVGLTFRRVPLPVPYVFSAAQAEQLARLEHRRWQQFVRRNGRRDHAVAEAWEKLGAATQLYNTHSVQVLPALLASVGLEIIDPRVG